eukprot:1177017-Prorocentrum_minimum.AAC.2
MAPLGAPTVTPPAHPRRAGSRGALAHRAWRAQWHAREGRGSRGGRRGGGTRAGGVQATPTAPHLPSGWRRWRRRRGSAGTAPKGGQRATLHGGGGAPAATGEGGTSHQPPTRQRVHVWRGRRRRHRG